VSSEKEYSDFAVRSLLSRHGLNSDLVVHCFSQTLLTAKIFFSGLHGHMAQQELNLLEFASRRVAQTGTGSSEVMRREFQDSDLSCVLLDDMPHHFFCHFISPDFARATDAAKQSSMSNVGGQQPIVYRLLDPSRHRYRSYMTGFAD